MPLVYLQGGLPLMSVGQVATSQTCCCDQLGPCQSRFDVDFVPDGGQSAIVGQALADQGWAGATYFADLFAEKAWWIATCCNPGGEPVEILVTGQKNGNPAQVVLSIPACQPAPPP